MQENTRGRTTDLVRLRILEEIKAGILMPGAKLVTETLARRYGVSRTPVREALIRLEQDGLAESGPNTGCVLRALSIEELCEIYEIREALEGMAVERIIRHGVPAELISELKSFCELRRADTDRETLESGDLAFHQAICRHCGSAAIRGIIDSYLILSTIFCVSPLMTHQSRRRTEEANREHEAIVAALEAGNGRLARKLLCAHIAVARKALLGLLHK